MTGVLKCLFGLHARGLTQEKLVLEDVYVKKRAVSSSFFEVNPFMPNGISHSYQLDQLISVLRIVGLYLSFLFKFQLYVL